MPDRVDFSLLIPELPDWNNGNGIDIDRWLQCKGDLQLAIAFSRLFWPEFVEHDGCVLHAEFSPTSYTNFFAAYSGDRAAVEAVMNHRHINDLFPQSWETSTGLQVVYLGKVLKEIWTVKLHRDFPSRVFAVEFDEGPLAELVEYQLTFWQPANRPTPSRSAEFSVEL